MHEPEALQQCGRVVGRAGPRAGEYGQMLPLERILLPRHDIEGQRASPLHPPAVERHADVIEPGARHQPP